jgi:hypothetical protein
MVHYLWNQDNEFFLWEGNTTCCSINFSNYDSISNKALKHAWLAQNKALDVEMRVLLSHGKWENPWTSSFIDLLYIIDCCSLEIMKMLMWLQMTCL